MAKKQRLDELVVIQGLAENIDIAKRFIMAGEIRAGDRVWDKAGEKIPADTILELKSKAKKFVSKGALKLERGLSEFKIEPKDKICLDIGSSTGGFTHVLLLNGAKEVFAVDVGYGLLDIKLRNDKRVKLFEKTNFRNLDENFFEVKFDIVVTDVSFISLLAILPNAINMMKSDGKIIALIKPQFEAKRSQVPEGGVIKNPEIQIEVIENLKTEFEKIGLYLNNITPVPLVSRKKNIEFISLWTLKSPSIIADDIKKIVNLAHKR